MQKENCHIGNEVAKEDKWIVTIEEVTSWKKPKGLAPSIAANLVGHLASSVWVGAHFESP